MAIPLLFKILAVCKQRGLGYMLSALFRQWRATIRNILRLADYYTGHLRYSAIKEVALQGALRVDSVLRSASANPLYH